MRQDSGRWAGWPAELLSDLVAGFVVWSTRRPRHLSPYEPTIRIHPSNTALIAELATIQTITRGLWALTDPVASPRRGRHERMQQP